MGCMQTLASLLVCLHMARTTSAAYVVFDAEPMGSRCCFI
jgi:hypothetical protein